MRQTSAVPIHRPWTSMHRDLALKNPCYRAHFKSQQMMLVQAVVTFNETVPEPQAQIMNVMLLTTAIMPSAALNSCVNTSSGA